MVRRGTPAKTDHSSAAETAIEMDVESSDSEANIVVRRKRRTKGTQKRKASGSDNNKPTPKATAGKLVAKKRKTPKRKKKSTPDKCHTEHESDCDEPPPPSAPSSGFLSPSMKAKAEKLCRSVMIYLQNLKPLNSSWASSLNYRRFCTRP